MTNELEQIRKNIKLNRWTVILMMAGTISYESVKEAIKNNKYVFANETSTEEARTDGTGTTLLQ
jgi:hypothetical protein